LGVFPSDKLNPLKNFEGGAIINLCRSNTGGCHWIAVFKKDRKSKLEYFDSSGLWTFLLDDNIISFILENAKAKSKLLDSLLINYVQIQSNNSIQCGKFSMLFLFYRSRKKSMKQFLSLFHHNPKKLEKNDKIVKKLYKKHFIDNNRDVDIKKKCKGCNLCKKLKNISKIMKVLTKV